MKKGLKRSGTLHGVILDEVTTTVPSTVDDNELKGCIEQMAKMFGRSYLTH
jgi:hypothetical protein